MKNVLLLLLVTVALFVSCRKESSVEHGPLVPPVADQVVFDPAEVPYATLSTYRFFKGRMADQVPVVSVLPYDLITPLFTDYAEKKRFVWMPAGVRAQYDGDHNVLDFPDGAVLLKTFYYSQVQPSNEPRILETRMLFRRNGVWEFANYVWNAEQTEAYLDLTGSVTPVTFTDENGVERSIQYRIPGQAECATCHRLGAAAIPLGPEPQNLNKVRTYADGVRNQLVRWAEQGYLAPGYPKNIVSTVAWDDPSQAVDLRVRSYLDANCSHCHADQRQCSYRSLRLNFDATTNTSLIGVCMPPEDPVDASLTYNIAPNNVARSAMHFRLNTNDEATRMPLIGRSVVHAEGVQLLEAYIQSLTQPCD